MKTLQLTAEHDAQRLDIWLSAALPDLSRSRIQALIREGHVLVDEGSARPNQSVRVGQTIEVTIPETPSPVPVAQELPLDVLYEDDTLIVINKSAGMVVHPAPGHPDGTLVNALLHRCPGLTATEENLRPGIAHRLDQDTSGAMVVACTNDATLELIRLFKERDVTKEYLAITRGVPRDSEGTIRTPIGRDPRNRKRMSAEPDHGKPAVTHYTVLEEQNQTALLRCRIETGRTHQIRVHLSHIGVPILGDSLYGGSGKNIGATVTRQMLHAYRLAFPHPADGRPLDFLAQPPADIMDALHQLHYRWTP